jgi:hypothetical protein
MRLKVRGESLCIIAEDAIENVQLQRIGADPDRAMVSVEVYREGVDLPPPSPSFERTVIALSRKEDI